MGQKQRADEARARLGLEAPSEIKPTIYIIERDLAKNAESYDASGRLRPEFSIAGRRVVFKNRMEKVALDNRAVTIVGAESTAPVQLKKMYAGTEAILDNNSVVSEEAQLQIHGQLVEDDLREEQVIHDLDEYNRAHSEKADEPENVLVVTNTPLGLIEAAIILGNSDLQPIADLMKSGKYSDPDCIEIIDNMIAAMAISDEGTASEKYDTDGLALALAAMTGNADARAVIALKRGGLESVEKSRLQAIQEQSLKAKAGYEIQGIEPLPLDHMFLVHSTAFMPEIQDDGSLAIYPTGRYVGDVPRASVHFTINSNVFPHAQANGAWGAENSIIIAPVNETIQQNGKPRALEGVDTWFTVNPGEPLRIPESTLVVPVSESEHLVEQTGNVVRVLTRAEYTPQEQAQIVDFMRQVGMVEAGPENQVSRGITAKELREAVVRQVLQARGVQQSECDSPSQDGHGMTNSMLANRIHATAANLGIESGTHFNFPEAGLEKSSYALLKHMISPNPREAAFSDGRMSAQDSAVGQACPQMIRQVFVSGSFEATPPNRAKPLDTSAMPPV